MSYKNTFVVVSTDCPVDHHQIPVPKGDKLPGHIIEYDLLTRQPYTLDHEGLIFEVYIRRQGMELPLGKAEKKELWDALFSKGHPCMRASALVKRYGFGAHYDTDGRIAIYPMESKEYKQFIADNTITKVPGMRTSRAK